MSKQYLYGIHSVEGMLTNNPQHILEIYIQEHSKKFGHIIALAHQHQIAYQKISSAKLNKILPNCNHQGVVAVIKVARVWQEADLINLLDELAQKSKSTLLLILDGIQDPHNLGACLRTANALGVDAVLAPKDRAVTLTPTVYKVASGAAGITPFVQVTNLARTIRLLQKRGIWIYGAVSEGGQELYKVNYSGQVALVLGAENQGLRKLTKEICDELVTIPMLGNVASLNVSVAAGICLYEVVRSSKKT